MQLPVWSVVLLRRCERHRLIYRHIQIVLIAIGDFSHSNGWGAIRFLSALMANTIFQPKGNDHNVERERGRTKMMADIETWFIQAGHIIVAGFCVIVIYDVNVFWWGSRAQRLLLWLWLFRDGCSATIAAGMNALALCVSLASFHDVWWRVWTCPFQLVPPAPVEHVEKATVTLSADVIELTGSNTRRGTRRERIKEQNK